MRTFVDPIKRQVTPLFGTRAVLLVIVALLFLQPVPAATHANGIQIPGPVSRPLVTTAALKLPARPSTVGEALPLIAAVTESKHPVTIQTTVTPPFIDAGQPITISFVVMPGIVSPQWPTGEVTIRGVNGEELCTLPHTTGSCTFTPLKRGSASIDYSGDLYFEPSHTSVFVPLRVGTAVSIDALPNPVGAGEVMTLTAGIRSEGVACAGAFFCAPTGQVHYYDNGVYLTSAGVHPRVGAVFPVTVTLMLPGRHHITGHYSGDNFYTFSTSQPLTVEVVRLRAYLPLILVR